MLDEETIRERVRAACEERGVAPTATALGLSAEATARLAGRLRVRAGTIALARQHLSALDDLVTR